jgi:hypothetical protein
VFFGPAVPWSNPFDPQNPQNTNWQIWDGQAWQAVPANSPISYPGEAGIQDTVLFDRGGVFADCDLDVALATPLFSLQFTGWAGTLTLNQDLTISNGGPGLLMADNSTITLGANKTLYLAGNTTGVWIRGTITGATGSVFEVDGSLTTDPGILAPVSTPGGLGTNMDVYGTFTLARMSNNLALTGTDNVIDATVGTLSLSQHIVNQGDQNTLGGIALAGTHTGPHAVQIEDLGLLVRPDVGGSQNGVPDQVSIGGTVFNAGGALQVGPGEMLNITGTDANTYSYWQYDPLCVLYLSSGANLKVAGTCQIDRGQVQLTAPSGGSADELDTGLGLNFGHVSATWLDVADANPGTTGSVTIQGPVTLANSTTTTLNYKGGQNPTADLLDVKNGALTLAGTLRLNSNGSGKPAGPLNFLDDSGPGPAINGVFASITGDIAGAVYTPNKVVNNPQLIYYQVTIT